MPDHEVTRHTREHRLYLSLDDLADLTCIAADGIVRHDDGREMVRVNVKPGHVIKEIDGIYLDNIVKIEMIQP